MLHILKDIVINVLSIVVVGVLAFISLFLIVEMNYIGLLLAIILLGIYVTLLCVFYKKLFSKRLFISFEFITSVFWLGVFLLINYLPDIGFGNFSKFFISLFAVFISVITFICTSLVLFIKNRKKKIED